jgi:hypothetical protein
MSEYSYSVRIGVDKELPPVSSGDYDVDFCSTGAANQTPPKLQISLAAFGTAAVDGVIAECYTVGTSNVNILPASPFATAAASWVYLRESSGHAAANIAVGETAVGMPILRLKAGDAALFRRDDSVTYPLAASAASTAATGTVQVVVIGD